MNGARHASLSHGTQLARYLALYRVQVRIAIRSAMSDRASFALQVAGMLLNNLVMLLLWWLFFAGFKRIGDWQRIDMALLMGLIMLIVGIGGVCFGGYRDLAAVILRGELDALLTQPKGLLARLLARESLPTAFGDFICGVLLLGFAGVQLVQLPWLLIAVACGTTVFVSAGVSFASLAFWVAGARSFARDLVDFTVLFSTYPGSIYQGAVRLVAYTVLPAGFVVLLPLQVVRAPTIGAVAMVIGSALVYAALAATLFKLGMRRYRRGLAHAD